MSTKAPGRPFVKGDPRAGRPKGRLNNVTVDIAELARSLTTRNPDYIASLKRRIATDTLPSAIENTLLYYAHGKPSERVEVTGTDGGPLRTIMRVIVDPRADATDAQA